MKTPSWHFEGTLKLHLLDFAREILETEKQRNRMKLPVKNLDAKRSGVCKEQKGVTSEREGEERDDHIPHTKLPHPATIPTILPSNYEIKRTK